MKKLALLLIFIFSLTNIYSQNLTFDNLNANYASSKSITWFSSNYGNGFGHRIINSDPGGITLLNFQGRHNTGTWSNILTLTSNGNVGIGTTSPTEKLQIAGGLYLNSGSDIDNIYWAHHNLNMGTRPGSYNHNIFNLKPGGASQGLLFSQFNMFIANSETNHVNKVRIHTNGDSFFNGGNVGIGTTSPTKKLHVSGSILSDKLLLNKPNEVTNWNTLWQSGFYESFEATNAPETDGWFWGINMNHRSNNSNYRYSGQIVVKNNSTNPTMYFRSVNADGIGTWAKIIHSVGNQKIDGTLAIGTATTGTHKLAVEGSIGAREIKVQLTGWSDFVFENTYNLPTLEEVEKHIQENGYLKDIPSAREVKENGIYLGEMDAKLLQKIEELTLYTIEQEKKLKEQAEKNNSQEEEIKEIKKQLTQLLKNTKS